LRTSTPLIGTDGTSKLITLSGEKSTGLRPFRQIDVGLLAWVLFLWVAAALVAVALVPHRQELQLWWAVLAMAAIGALAERQSVPVTATTEASVGFLPFVFSAVAFGPLAAMVVGALAAAGDFRRPYMRAVTYIPVRALSLAAAGCVANLVGAHGTTAFTGILLACLAAAATHQAADLGFNLGTQAVRRKGSPMMLVRSVGPLLALSAALYVPLVALLVYGYKLYSIWVAATFLVPAVALQRLTRLYQEQRETAVRLAEANVRLEVANLSFASALVATLDARDRYTAGHSAAVAVYARDIAARMSLGDDDQNLAYLSGLVHDIGKIGLPPGLLEKPGALTLEERRQMEQHSAIGEHILAKVDDYSEIAAIVRHHHERVDGLGYPDGLSAEEIPLIARIIAVADAYNAMTSDRPYRDAMPSRVARMRLAQAVGSQFDTSVVAAFEALLATAPEEYRSGVRADFRIEAQRALKATAGAA
jgi:putative nucleotidyltransferase with HDIG domain